MSIPPQTYMLDKNNTHIQEIHTSQFPGPSNTTIETVTESQDDMMWLLYILLCFYRKASGGLQWCFPVITQSDI